MQTVGQHKLSKNLIGSFCVECIGLRCIKNYPILAWWAHDGIEKCKRGCQGREKVKRISDTMCVELLFDLMGTFASALTFYLMLMLM